MKQLTVSSIQTFLIIEGATMMTFGEDRFWSHPGVGSGLVCFLGTIMFIVALDWRYDQ